MNLRPAAPGRQCVLSAAVLASAFAVNANAQSPDTVANTRATPLEEVLVVAQRANRTSNGATNLNLEIKDTPQSISVVSQEQMEQFGADNLNDALRLTTGIQVTTSSRSR